MTEDEAIAVLQAATDAAGRGVHAVICADGETMTPLSAPELAIVLASTLIACCDYNPARVARVLARTATVVERMRKERARAH